MPGPRDFALLACLVAASTAAAADAPQVNLGIAPDPASVRRFGPAYRYPQDGWTVLHIEGAPYDRGYQHGKLMAEEVADYVATLAKVRSTRDPSAGWRGTRTLVNAVFLRRYDPEYLEEMKGIADGAASAGAKFDGRAIDLLDIVAVNSELETSCLESALDATATGLEGKVFADPVRPGPKAEKAEHCSAFAATGPATKDGKIVFGHITMFSLYEVRHYNVWLDVKPAKGHRVLMQSFAGGIHSGLDYYLNDAGLLVAETTIGQTRFGEAATPLASRIRKVMQYSDSIDGAVAILKESNNGLYTNEWLIGDTKTDEIAMFELGTGKTKLWRSSQNDWPGATPGFFWGCNNTKDLEVRLETVASVEGKPANVAFRPSPRDEAWQALYETHKGKIDPSFGFQAFMMAPLAAYSSCDAKFTTSAMARDLKTYALFGPPLGRAWEPSSWERSRYDDIRPLVRNDWTVLHADAPAASASGAVAAVDLGPEGSKGHDDALPDAPHDPPPAWHGTILPSDDEDLWLAAAFADYEKIVALEKALVVANDGKMSPQIEERIALGMFAQRERFQSAARRLGRDVSPLAPLADVRRSEPYDIAAGKGVWMLHNLRMAMGREAFDAMMDRFGRAHAGKTATTAEFRRAAEQAAGKALVDHFDGKVAADAARSVDEFGHEPDRALIVYGTLRDMHAQREAASILQDRVARRWYNHQVPIKADVDVTDDDLRTHHLLLIGRPATNSVSARVAEPLPVKFAAGSFKVGADLYGHESAAVAVAGPNPLSDGRFTAVLIAGLSAESTRLAVGRLFERGPMPCQYLVMPHGKSGRPGLLPVGPTTPQVAGGGAGAAAP